MAHDDAAAFIASNGAIRGAMLQAVLDTLRQLELPVVAADFLGYVSREFCTFSWVAGADGRCRQQYRTVETAGNNGVVLPIPR
ncbi:DUF2388 domain-containing protein [Pseudomonas aeruginosa]